jgi:VIT1/CCC1 family predicted Fe2+/Mn2+ transporter
LNVTTNLEAVAEQQAKEELFAYRIYSALASRVDGTNGLRLNELAEQERSHLDFWLGVTGGRADDVRTSRIKYSVLLMLSRIIGPAFTIRWLERGEDRAIESYKRLLGESLLTGEQRTRIEQMLREEEEHEVFLERGIEDDRRLYLGAAVLGLNDALVELTGGLTGLVSSIADPRLIGFASLVIGVAASMSMAASNFLSVDIGEESKLRPGKAAAYTGGAYIVVVIGLVLPFFLLSDRHVALLFSWAAGIIVIAAFSFYSSVMQGVSFVRRFAVMLALGAGVAVVSYVVGRVLGAMIGIETV